MDRDLVAIEAKGLHLPPIPLESPAQIDEAIDYLTAQLTRIADTSTPRRKVSYGRGEPWWNIEVHEALHQARSARRQYAASPTESHWRSLQEAGTHQLRTIRNAKTRNWRGALDEASRDTRQLWRLERWARLRSHLPPDPLSLPPLLWGQGQGEAGRAQVDRSQPDIQPDCSQPGLPSGAGEPLATSHADKASILARRFFPHSAADLSDINLDLQDDSHQRFPIDQTVKEAEITTILRETGAWKAPGPDLLPTGFLKACKGPLAKLLAQIATACLQLEHFPTQFRAAKVVVLRKPGKTIAQQQTAGAYRPISLLNSMGKVIEKVISKRIAAAAETQGLLPETQMGNRPERSTDLAIKLVVDATHTAWRHGAVASLLQLDIKGVFDTVNHTRLLYTLQL
jgi:hypothetical protein